MSWPLRAHAADVSDSDARSHAARAGAHPGTRRGRVEALAAQLVARATGGGGTDDALYARLRQELLTDPVVGPRIPRYVRMARDLGQFWEWIRDQRPSYEGRRELIWTDFGPILEHLDRLDDTPAPPLPPAPPPFDSAALQAAWTRALERRLSDPDGAVRAARALLERACRHVLDRAAAPYPADADLRTLYELAAGQLEPAPGSYGDRGAGPLLGGCRAVVEGLAAARQRSGGAASLPGRPAGRMAARHAELAVNLAGSVALFLTSAAVSLPADR